jgi:pilus assembly protein FimV
VVLGSPADLSFDVQPDPGTDVASSCVAVKVVAGDVPLSDAKVRVVPLPDMRGRSPAIRVQTSVAVDEPVLTVTVSAGCAGKVTRTYTFLAELPAVASRSASPLEISRLPSAGAPGSMAGRAEQNTAGTTGAAPPSRLVAGVQAPSLSGSQPAAVNSVPRAATASPAQPRAARPPAAPRAARKVEPKPRTVDGPRLVVEPLDLWLDSPVALRASPELLITPSEEPSAQRAQAAALWKALNAQPDDVQPDEERLKALEADVAQLRSQASRDQAKAAQLQQQLEQAENERLPVTWFYAMAGLLLLALLFAAWAWSRMRSASEKAVRAWRDSVTALGGREALAQHEATLGLVPHPQDAWTSTDAAADATLPGASGEGMPRFVPTTPTASAPAPLKAGEPPAATGPAQAVASPPSPPAPVAGAVSASGMHIVSPEELFDIQQQAEFFISVGEHQQAIEVLRKHIAERGDTSPLAYLELLRLYHSLSRADEFAQLRTQFMQSFNAQVPEFAGFHRTGRMLYHYTEALAAIEAEWSSPSVLLLLEKMMFKQGGISVVEPFDLAAYDDLLLLLAIAQTTPASARGAPPPRERTTPAAAPRDEALAVHHVHPAAPAPASDLRLSTAHASLDFEFDEMFPPASAPAPEPQAPSAARRDGFDTRGAPLDLDLSDPPHLTLNDLPPVPVTAPPAPGQAVGFGLENDRVELRLELEQKKTAGS